MTSDNTAARQSLDQAITIARKTQQVNRWASLMQFIAQLWQRLASTRMAQRKTELLTLKGDITFALRDIAVAQARNGDLSGAKQTAEKMRLIMVREEREAGKLYNPTENEDRLSQYIAAEELAMAQVLADIAVIQASASRPMREEANQTINQVLVFVDADQPLRPDLASISLATAALAQATLGKATMAHVTFTCALKIARSLQPCPGSEIMAQVVERQWRAGQEADARIVLQKAFERYKPQSMSFPQVYDRIIEIQMKVGDLDGALQTAHACHNDQGELTLRPDVLRGLVQAQAASSSPSVTVADWYKLTRSPLF